MTDRSHWFVTTEWLAGHLRDPGVVIVDGSWHLANTGRDAEAEYRAEHIPGAVFFDIDEIADKMNPLPHMLPSAEQFANAVGLLGIDEHQKIVVYDSVGLSSAPRVWWTFKVMGADDVVLLEGGLPKWKSEGRPVDDMPVTRNRRRFAVQFDSNAVRDLDQVREAVANGTMQIVDARPAPRFRGEAPEPRSWVKSGRIPGSFNVPHADLVVDGRMREAAELKKAFVGAGLDLSKPILTSCGSGVNAAALSLALDIIGIRDTALYDGSWTEWGSRGDTPIVGGTKS